MIKVCVLGGSGFIGSHLIKSLKNKQNVTVLSPSKKELNLLNKDKVFAYFEKHRADVVVNLASVGGVKGKEDPDDAFYINMRMFTNVFDAVEECRKERERFIFISSGAIYDKSKSIRNIKESSKRVPQDKYGYYKYICDCHLLNYEGFNVVLRPFGVFGVGEEPTRFPTYAIERLKRGKTVEIKEDSLFSYIYIKDFVKIIEYFIFNSSQFSVCNIAHSNPLTMKQIASIIKQLLGSKSKIKVLGKGKEYTCSNKLLMTEFEISGYKFKFTPHEEAFSEMIKEYAKIH